MNKLDVLRTRLRDMLFGRTKIKVVNIENGEDVVPTFLIGTFRSGTTFFRYLLDSHSQLCCPPETKFLVHLASMRNTKSTFSAFENMGIDELFVKHEMLQFANGVYSAYLRGMEKTAIVDKTPEYVRALDFIDWLYDGRCKFILIFRNGLDVAQSMNSTHVEPLEPDKTIDSAFEYWLSDTETMLAWMSANQERCHKVVYDQLCDDTSSVLSGVMDFIGLGLEQRQLRWYEFQHTRGDEDIKARRQRTINKSVRNYLEWPTDKIEDLKRRASGVHSAIGYDPETLDLR